MCGIIGYTGFRPATTVLLDGLKHLDYRGYDSAGIAVYTNKNITVLKAVGQIQELEKKVPTLASSCGIGHTRWATHGVVNEENAHPHVSTNGKISVIHNGIIDNFIQLKEDLQNKGYTFTSQTDSEIFAHLIQDNYNGNLHDAVKKAIQYIKGSYAIVVLCADEPDILVGARQDSPLVIGNGDNENFLSSDISALLPYTKRVTYLEDGETCIITKNDVTVYDVDGTAIQRSTTLITWDVKDAEKSGFPHFMLKEIYEQPESINHVLQGRLSELDRTIIFPQRVQTLLEQSYSGITIVACGTSFYAGLVGRYLFEYFIKTPVSVQFAHEYRYFNRKHPSFLVIAISQSGETADTLAAIKQAKSEGCNVLVISNVMGSTATRIADAYLLTQSGPEIGVAATKTFTSQITLLSLIALKLAEINHNIGADQLYNYIKDLKEIPRWIRKILQHQDTIKQIAKKIKDTNSVFFIGRGINYPLSLEGALKLKEISYIHAEGFPAGELKHGPFALLTKDTPVITLLSQDQTYEKMLGNIGEVHARGPPVYAISSEDDTEIEKFADLVLRYPGSNILSGLSIAVILQLLAYHTADLRKCSIDKPRNLAKSVTVE